MTSIADLLGVQAIDSRNLTFGSVCSGIEAASVAWEPLGWSAVWFAEIDKGASEVLAYRFPDVPNHGDMTMLAGMVRARAIPAPEVLVGGTPCQSFSIAGLRGGLRDARGQLTLAFVDLANAIDEVRINDGQDPVIVVWENVPGVLTHIDNPLGCFLGALAGDDDPLEPGPRPEPGRSSSHWTWDKKSGVHRAKWSNAGAAVGPQRAVAWVIKDAQYFGLAQRRRRVFVVASARARFDPAAVLLEFDGLRRDSAPSREAREDVAGALDARAAGGGFPGTDGACANHVVASDLRSARIEPPVPTWWDGREVSQTLDAVLHKGQTMPEKNRFPAVLQPIDAYAFQSRIARNGRGDMGDLMNALTASAGVSGRGDGAPCVAYAIQERAISENPNAGPDGVGVRADGCGYTLEARGVPQAVAVMYSIMPMNSGRDFKAREVEVAQPLMAAGPVGGNQGGDYVLQHYEMAVRRLMPVECERLQGFPDNWTLVPTGKARKPAADGPRYKQCGNSMATLCMNWIGRRIQAALTPTFGHNGGPTLSIMDMVG